MLLYADFTGYPITKWRKDMTLEETLQDFIVVTRDRFLETDMKFQDTDKKIRKLEGLFTSQWGKLIEAMVQPAALKLFQNRGIKVNESMQRVEIKKPDLQKEFDIILVNGDVVIVVEVKSTLKIEDVKKHMECLKIFHKYMPEYKDKKVYGAVAYINCDEQSDKFAYRNGLFVITLSGDDIVEIKNDLDFIPVNFVE
ncbi:MAG: hypothetical protein V1910_01200 [bacterium]